MYNHSMFKGCVQCIVNACNELGSMEFILEQLECIRIYKNTCNAYPPKVGFRWLTLGCTGKRPPSYVNENIIRFNGNTRTHFTF